MTRTQRQIEEHRQGGAVIEVRDSVGPCADVPVWVEQETHAFVFGCVAPDLEALPVSDRERCIARLNEVFNRLATAGQPLDPGALVFNVPDGVSLRQFYLELDRLSSVGLPLAVYVRGKALGRNPEDRAVAERVAALYTLGFAHPAVRALVWHGFWDGEPRADGGGLLRRDFAPRPSFRFLHKLIGTIWHSRASGDTDADGLFRFRGFFGDYRVVARIGETAPVARFAFHGGTQPSVFVLAIPDGPRSNSCGRGALSDEERKNTPK